MASHSRIEFEECLKKGLIRKSVPSRDKAHKGIIEYDVFFMATKTHCEEIMKFADGFIEAMERIVSD